MKTRLFVGGLHRSTIQDSDVVQLFSSFGSVEDFVRIPDKEYTAYCSDSVHKDVYERNFAYVSLEVEEERHAKRAVGALNGTKWKGCSLRCQFAKPSGIEKVLGEIKRCDEEDEEDKDKAGGAVYPIAEAPLRLEMAPFASSSDGCIVSVPVRGDASHTPQKKYFESDEDGCSAAVVDGEKKWDAIDAPRNVYNYEQHLHQLQAAGEQQQQHDCSTASSSGDMVHSHRMKESYSEQQSKRRESAQMRSKRTRVGDEASKVAATAVETILKRQRLGAMHSLNPQLRTVNFFTAEEDAGRHGMSQNIDLSRFDSDSNDDSEQQHIPQVDGAMDSSSDPLTSMPSTSVESLLVAHEATSNDADTDTHADTHADTSEQEEEEEEEEENGNAQSQAQKEQEEELSTLYKIFPNAAKFKRRDPIEHVEAQWRAEKDSLLKELKEARRQALRAQGEKKNSGRS